MPIFAAMSRRGVTLLPVLEGTPAWAGKYRERGRELPGNPPRDPADFAAFASAMVSRYGASGSFWAERPDLPRRPPDAWQVWNEPNIQLGWTGEGWAEGYAALLHAAAPAIRAADPQARVILAALTNSSWEALDRLYGVVDPRDFDVVAIHPYTQWVADVLRIVNAVRGVMARHGDADRPLWLTELGWPASARGMVNRYGFETTGARQAARLRAIVPALVRRRMRLRLERVYWESWMTSYASRSNPFDYAGLRRVSGRRVLPGPAFAAFREVARRLSSPRGLRGGRAYASRSRPRSSAG